MQKLTAFAAPARYVFRDPDTKYEYLATSKAALVNHITNYRVQNRLKPIEHLDAVLENYWCGLPENLGRCEPLKLKRGLLSYVKGGVGLLETVLMKHIVSSEEAEARAKICAGCPLNVFPDKDGFIKWSDAIAEAATGGKKTTLDEQLGNCSVCSCTLKAKVWFGGKLRLKPEERKQMLEVNCWQPQWERGRLIHGK